MLLWLLGDDATNMSIRGALNASMIHVSLEHLKLQQFIITGITQKGLLDMDNEASNNTFVHFTLQCSMIYLPLHLWHQGKQS